MYHSGAAMGTLDSVVGLEMRRVVGHGFRYVGSEDSCLPKNLLDSQACGARLQARRRHCIEAVEAKI